MNQVYKMRIFFWFLPDLKDSTLFLCAMLFLTYSFSISVSFKFNKKAVLLQAIPLLITVPFAGYFLTSFPVCSVSELFLSLKR